MRVRGEERVRGDEERVRGEVDRVRGEEERGDRRGGEG